MTVATERAARGRALHRTSADRRRIAGERLFQCILLAGLGVGLLVLGILL